MEIQYELPGAVEARERRLDLDPTPFYPAPVFWIKPDPEVLRKLRAILKDDAE